jgi:hypothetical protein
VLAFEPSPILAALAMDRLNRGSDSERSITLVEGTLVNFTEPFAADFILMRSVLMLLDDADRATALNAAARHSAAGARLIVDAAQWRCPGPNRVIWKKKDGSDRRRTVDAPGTRAKRKELLVSTGQSKPCDSGGRRQSPKNSSSSAPIQ